MRHGTFDPYHQWLGIPPAEQPPDHYRLLGIARFEHDLNVIDAAANRQMAHLRTYQTSDQAVWSQRLLNEVAAARVCLLQVPQREAYDALLRAAQPLSALPVAAPVEAAPPAIDFLPDGAQSPVRAARQQRNALFGVLASIIAAIAFILLAVIVWLNTSSENKELGERSEEPQPRAETKKPTRTSSKPAEPNGDPKKRKWKFTTSRGSTESLEDVETLEAAPAPVMPGFEGLAPLEGQPTPAKVDTKPAAPPRPPTGKRPIPVAVSQAKAALQVNELFSADLAKAVNPLQKQQLARQLLSRGRSETDLSLAYALLDKAKSLAVESGEMLTAIEAIDALAQRFEVDAFALKGEALAHFGRTARTPIELMTVVNESRKGAETALAADQLEAAERLSEIALSTGRKFNNPTLTTPLVALNKRIRQQREKAQGGNN